MPRRLLTYASRSLAPLVVLRCKTVILSTNAIHLLRHAHLVFRLDAVSSRTVVDELSSKGKRAISLLSVGEAQDGASLSNQARAQQDE